MSFHLIFHISSLFFTVSKLEEFLENIKLIAKTLMSPKEYVQKIKYKFP